MNYFNLMVIVTFELVMLMFLNALPESNKTELSCWPIVHGLSEIQQTEPKDLKKEMWQNILFDGEREKK